MTSNQTSPNNDPFRVAIVAAERLRSALSAHGITVPSLRGGYPCMDVPMVELGGCSATVAEALATVLERVASE